MQVKDYLVASGVSAITAQRLVRKVCMFCQEEYEISSEELEKFGFSKEMLQKLNVPEKLILKRGKGCEHCKNTGYLGRTVIAELLIINEEISDLIVKGATPLVILKKAKEHGMRTLKEDGLIKIIKGITTPEEIKKVVG